MNSKLEKTSLFTTPNEMVGIIEDFLTIEDLIQFSFASKNSFFKAKNNLRVQLAQLVANSRQVEVERIVKFGLISQDLLTTPSKFSDPAGRTFYCTPYEYVCWAKDIYLMRILESYMDNETKGKMKRCCELIETRGLKYIQNGIEKCSSCFDFTPLITKMLNFICIHQNPWKYSSNEKKAFLSIGIEQSNLPAHVIHEYGHVNRPFYPLPTFKDHTPRQFKFAELGKHFSINSPYPKLGKPYTLIRYREQRGAMLELLPQFGAKIQIKNDMNALIELDKIRTAQRNQIMYNLNSSENNYSCPALRPVDMALTH